MSLSPKVALSKDFLDALAKLPQSIQKKVRNFTEKFQADPTQSGINFERLQSVRDDKVRSVRIDQAYRAIVVHPPKGDVFLCVWVDHHDEAYAWVRNKRFEVNPTSGVMQLYEVQEHTEVITAPKPVAAPAAKPPSGLFASWNTEDLLFAGVPLPLLPSIRALQSEFDLDAIKPHLPEDAAEALYGLAAGMPLLDAVADAMTADKRPATVDTNDFAKALAEPTSQRHFKIVNDESDLAAIFDQPLEQWRLFLHPSQRRLVEAEANGPMRVLGGAGTGKTVVMMHRAKHLARMLKGDQKLLVTTFTRNLARDLANNLRVLCGTAIDRIEVTNLHSWAMQFLLRQGIKFRLLDKQEERERRMELASAECGAINLAESFFLEEWDRVVQAQEILDEAAYLKARRTGRGVRLDRATRGQVWQVFRRYRQGMERDNVWEWQDIIRESRLFIEKKDLQLSYAAVCADEVQDFTASELRLIRALVPAGPNDLFLVGDGHQRIYGQPVVLSHCGIEVRGRSRRLRLNYRTTDRIARQGMAILKNVKVDDLDGEADTLQGYTSLRQGIDPEQHLFAAESEEGELVVSKVQQWLASGRLPEHICVAARTSRAVKQRYQPLLEQAGIPTTILEGKDQDGHQAAGVRLGTLHRLKGLEFPCVLLGSVHDGMVPLKIAVDSADASTRKERLLQERCLLYVACTRARDELVISGYGKPSSLLR